MTICVGIGYAACTSEQFNSQADSETINLLKACPRVNGKLPDTLGALVGNCPTEESSQIDSICNNTAFPQADQQVACQSFYKKAYYGKVQTACHYLAAVEAAKPPPAAPAG